MAVSSKEVTVFGCDVSDCDVSKAGTLDGKLPAKFRAGTIYPGGDLTAVPLPWVACRDSHIGKAVASVVAADADSPHPEASEDEDEGIEPTDSAELPEESEAFDREEVPEFAGNR